MGSGAGKAVAAIPVLLLFLLVSTPAARGGDWPDWRGPARDGVSPEKDLPSEWSPAGENLLWKAPYGGRSAPVVLGNHLYLQNAAGEGKDLQERLLCLDATTGELLWEYRFNVFHSDVPPHRVAWASPVADPTTGNVYVFGVGGTLHALSADGALIWQRSLNEDFGLITTHGGRTVSPVIEGDLVIVSGLSSGWGSQARGSQRFFAFDKTSGQTVWVSQPGGRPYDTTYSPPIAAEINGTRLLIAGGGDGAVHAIKPQTGESVWRYEISKRGINTGAVLLGTTVFVSHGEENLDSSEMGMISAIDAGASGEISPEEVHWSVEGFLGGYSSAVTDGELIYQVDNGANLVAFSPGTGEEVWRLNLGTIQRASPVLADGKLYVGTQNGKFYILEPSPDGVTVLDVDDLGTAQAPEAIIASVAVSGGRVFLVSAAATYAIGSKSRAPSPSPSQIALQTESLGPAAHVQVVPTELVLEPGEAVRFRARLFDARGLFIRESEAEWSLDRLLGSIAPDGTYTASTEAKAQAGAVKATVAGLSGTGRLRVIPTLPITEDFESFTAGSFPSHWINTAGKYEVREIEGNKVLVKKADNPFLRRARSLMGPSDWSGYTVEADVRTSRKRRRMGDAGVIAQRTMLTLFGTHQRLSLQSWQPETQRTVTVPLTWEPDTWYRIKLRVENLAEGRVRVRGKAWLRDESEPAGWLIDRIESHPELQGSPGIYADAHAEVFFDNIRITPNNGASD